MTTTSIFAGSPEPPYQGDREPRVRTLLHFPRNRRNDMHSEYLRDRQFNFETRRKSEVHEGAFRP